MHPVIQHILDRKGKEVPLDDGRKITLVLFGGLMNGVRGAGALVALQDLGLSHSFDSIYTASAGFMNAAYMLSSDNGRSGSSVYYEDLSDKRFLNFLHFWNPADIDYVIDVVKNKKKINTENIWNSKTKLYLRLINSKKDKPNYIEIHNFKPEQFFDIAKAAISMPFLHPKPEKLGHKYFRDGELHWDAALGEINYPLASDATDILIIYNRTDQKMMNLYLSEIFNVEQRDRIYEICPDENWNLSRFETNPNKLKEACVQMGQKVMTEFGGGEFKL